nr:hypothetical protein Iba_chr06bCG6830 [Ipomoea batatas]GMD79364.1 hypothetical protein Iba_chr13dCG3160 [Ipomoea batatas]
MKKSMYLPSNLWISHLPVKRCYPNLWDSECAELIGMAARDLHAKYPKVLAGYMDIAKQRHGIDSTASQNCILRDHDSKLFILSYD